MRAGRSADMSGGYTKPQSPTCLSEISEIMLDLEEMEGIKNNDADGSLVNDHHHASGMIESTICQLTLL